MHVLTSCARANIELSGFITSEGKVLIFFQSKVGERDALYKTVYPVKYVNKISLFNKTFQNGLKCFRQDVWQAHLVHTVPASWKKRKNILKDMPVKVEVKLMCTLSFFSLNAQEEEPYLMVTINVSCSLIPFARENSHFQRGRDWSALYNQKTHLKKGKEING